MTRSNFGVRLAEVGDIADIFRIMESCCKNPWKREQLEEELRHDFSRLAVVERGEDICGFVLFHIVREDAHINELAVDLPFRRQGAATELMEFCVAEAKKNECAAIGLEVRSANRAAKGLYRSLGFEPLGVRGGFYRDPEDDAVVMRLKLTPGVFV